MADWRTICFLEPHLLSEEVCNSLAIDCASAGFGGEEWEVSQSDSAFALCVRNLVLHFAHFGFTNAEIDDAIRVTVELYGRLIVITDQSVIGDVDVFIEVIRRYASRFSSIKLAQLVEYLQKDLLQHKSLYKFCAIGQRQSGARSLELTVDTPPNDALLPLKNGLKKDVCEYEIKLKQLEAVETEEKNRLSEELAAKAAEREENGKQIVGKKVDDWLLLDSPQYKNVLEIIDAVVKHNADLLNTHVSTVVQNLELDLKFKLDKTALPRPVKLGAPPRFKPKPIIPLPKNDHPPTGLPANQLSQKIPSPKLNVNR